MKKVFNNFLLNAVYQVLLIFLPLITMPYLSRIFSPDVLGKYSYEYAIASGVALFGKLGINNYGNRSIAIVKNNISERSRRFFEIYHVQMIFSLATYIIYLFYAMLFSRYKSIALVLSFHVLSTFFDINWFFWGLEKFKVSVSRDIVIKLTVVFLIILLVKKETDLVLYTWIMSVGNLISHLAVWPFLKGDIKWDLRHGVSCKRHLKRCLILFIPIISQYLYKNMDRVMIELLNSTEQLGIYTNADKIAVVPVGIINAVGVVMLPVMSRMFAENKESKAKSVLNTSILFTNFLSIGMTFGLAAVSSDLVPVLLGDMYLESADLLIFLSSLIFLMAWTDAITTQYLIPVHKDIIYVKSIFLGTIVNFIVNSFFIARFGARGAVIGTIAAQSVVMLFQCITLRNDLPIKKIFKDMFPFVIHGIVIFIIIKLFSGVCKISTFKFIYEIFIGSFIYLVLNGFHIYIFNKALWNEIVSAFRRKQ